MVKNLPVSAGDTGNGQYSCLGNPMDRGAWWPIVHRVAKSRTRLSDFTFTLMSAPATVSGGRIEFGQGQHVMGGMFIPGAVNYK